MYHWKKYAYYYFLMLKKYTYYYDDIKQVKYENRNTTETLSGQ